MEVTRLFYSFLIVNPTISYTCKEYVKLLTKCHISSALDKFLSECLKEQVLPSSFLPRRLLHLDGKPFDKLENVVLSKTIKTNKLETKKLFKMKFKKMSELRSIVTSEDFNMINDYAYYKMRITVRRRTNYHQQKLNRLISRSKWQENIELDNVTNLSNENLDDNTVKALKYGLSFHIKETLNPIKIGKSLICFEKSSNLDPNEINICKGLVYSCFNENNVNFPVRFTKAISKLKNNDNIHITKADKSNSFVILNKNQYINKMNNLLEDESTYKKLNKNPLEKMNSSFNCNLRNILKSEDHNLIEKFKARMTTLPYMYGLVKTHKVHYPLRPIISTVGSATYKLSKYLVNMLSPLIGTISDSHIKNNVDFISKLNSNIPNYEYKLVSFDVTSLFTKVPINYLLEFLKPELEKWSGTLDLKPNSIIELIKLCVIDSKFVFQEQYYQQKFGLSMGNPLSPVLSNLYMEFFEKYLLTKIIDKKLVWFRYVDDIICLWPINLCLEEFMDKLNNLVDSIKFTFEIESDCKLPFLDIIVHRVNNVSFKYSVYRKPTSNNSFIHYYSGHSDNVKRSIFISMFLRAYRVCSPEFFDDEVSYIFDIGSKLKYPKTFIELCLSKTKKIFYRNNDNNNNNNKKMENILVLPFNEKLMKIKYLFKIINVDLVFSFKNTLKNILIKNSPTNNTSCLYKIPCNNCGSFYIGQTSKSLSIRIAQHKNYVRTAQENSAIFCHYQEYNHPVSWKDSSEILYISNFYTRNLLESILIKVTFDKNMNLSLGMYTTDKIIECFLKNDFSVKRILDNLLL